MSSPDCLREFVNNRLSAVAEEKKWALKNIVVMNEEEFEHQRRLLGVLRKPELKLHRIELPLQHIFKEEEEEEVLSEAQLCKEERDTGMDHGDSQATQLKEEQEELCISQEGEQLEVKQETDASMLTPAYEENDHSEEETLYLNPDEPLSAAQKESAINMPVIISVVGASNSDQLSNSSPAAESPDKKRETCEKDFEYMSKMYFKMNTGERPYVCRLCGKDFKRKNALCEHIRIHTGEKPYVCKTCGKDFRYRSHLTVHVRRDHTGEKPYLCKVCGKSFTVNSTLTDHLTIHTGKKPFICKTCGKDFRQHRLLIHHMTVHTGEKPYTCNTCGKDFRYRSHLTVHVRRAHTGEKPYNCKVCGKGFVVNGALTVHMRRHTREKPFIF